MKFLIYSNEHRAWWKPAEHGYTKNRSEAGLYDLQRACKICRNSNSFQPTGELPDEMMFPVWADENNS